MSEIAAQIKANGWRQGCLLPDAIASAIPELVGARGDAQRVLVVISQDCDVVHSSLDVEPRVELIAGTRSDEPVDSQLAHGKNPRWLHLRAAGGGRLEFSIRDRITAGREILAQSRPVDQLPDLDRDLLARWIAKRYTRSAFPDAFNERIRPASKKLDRAFKSCGMDASAVFLLLDRWGELGPDESYKVVVAVVFPVEVGDDAQREAKMAELAMKIRTSLDACDGIEVLDSTQMAENEFTLHDLHSFKRWELDFRSDSGRPGGSIVPTS